MRRAVLSFAAGTSLIFSLAACGGSGDGASACAPATAKLAVGAKDDLTFDAEDYSVTAGCVEVTYDNTGSVHHTLLVRGKSGFKLSVGDTDKGTLALTAGTYELFCDVTGHEAGGMKADLVVE